MSIRFDLDMSGGGGSAGVPAGFFGLWAGSGAPAGWLEADGSSVPVATYPALFNVIGYTYGGAGANFSLPDWRGIVGAGAGLGTALPGLTNHLLGAFFGEEAHSLTSGENGTHTHVQDAHTHVQDAHTHVQDSHNHTQDSHNHTQDAHTHTQNSHNHTQDAHTHTQNSHNHTWGNSQNYTMSNSTIADIGGTGGTTFSPNTSSTTATNQNTTATNQAATATNQNTTATNQATTATNQATTATNQNTTATNQNTTAVNQNSGSGTAHNTIQPTWYGTAIIKF